MRLKIWKTFFSLCWKWLLVRRCLAMAETRRWTCWAKTYLAKTRKRETTPGRCSLLTTVSQTTASDHLFGLSTRPLLHPRLPVMRYWYVFLCIYVFVLQVWRRSSRCVVRFLNYQTSCPWQTTHSWLQACSSTSSMTTSNVTQREPTSGKFVMNMLSTSIKCRVTGKRCGQGFVNWELANSHHPLCFFTFSLLFCLLSFPCCPFHSH